MMICIMIMFINMIMRMVMQFEEFFSFQDHTLTMLFQILAGPAFIVTFTFSALLMGFLADNFSRTRLLSAAITSKSRLLLCCYYK